jgi:hypothetical protein
MWHSPVFTCIIPNRIPVKRIKRAVVRNFEMQVEFSISLRSPPIALNKIYYGKHYRHNNICRRQETNFCDLRNFMIKSGK